MRQEVCARFTGRAESIRISARGDPHWQFRLYSAREHANLDIVAGAAPPLYLLSPPQGTHLLQIARHDRLAIRVCIRRKHEIPVVPSGSKRNSHPALSKL